MKEILTFLGKLIGLGIVGIIGGTAWFWIPVIISNCTNAGDVILFTSVFVSTAISIVTGWQVQFAFERLTDTN